MPRPRQALTHVFHWTRDLYNDFLERLNPPLLPNESEPDSELHDFESKPMQRTSTSGSDPADHTTKVDAIVVENGGFKCYKAMPSTAEEPRSRSSFDGGKDKTDTSSVNTDVEMNYLAAEGAPDEYGSRDSWARFFGLGINGTFGEPTEKQRKCEEEFWRERWFSSKKMCLLASIWLVVNWILAVGFANRPFNVMDNVWFYLVTPLLVLPLPLMIIEDMPSGGRSLAYQLWLFLGTWCPAWFCVIDGFLCGYFGNHPYLTCAYKDYYNIVYYSCALPAITMFGMHGNRSLNILGTVVFLTLTLVFIVPHRTSFVRHTVEIGVFHGFLLYTNFNREIANRRMFLLKEHMKRQFRSKQRAQIAERKEADSKRRLMNYIFHEVRVPLNTANLALENLEAHGIFAKSVSLEYTALKGSLEMMSQVLSDILDFNKMDAGQLVTVDRPYYLHRMIRSMQPGAALVGASVGVQVKLDLDDRIDTIARRCVLAQQGLPESEIQRRLSDPDTPNDGVVAGDEMRMRQIISNFITNAIKFNVPGPDSHCTIRTRLLKPTEGFETGGSETMSAISRTATEASFGAKPGEAFGAKRRSSPLRRLDSIVVRIEVEDSGVAVRASDMAQNRLFSPFVQTEIGRTQGGKGTGLGLALVRHIVALSGGRLGVISQKGVGSTFWIEMSLGVGQRALREPSWPDVASGTPVAFGFQFPRATPESSPMPTPSTDEHDTAASTPQGPDNQIDYVNYPARSAAAHHHPPHSSNSSTIAGSDRAHSSTHAYTPRTELDTQAVPIPPAYMHHTRQQRATMTINLVNALNSNPEVSDVPVPPPLAMPSSSPTTTLGAPTTSSSTERTYVNPESETSTPANSPDAVVSSPNKSAPRKKPQVNRVGEGLRVLVVDDDLMTRRLMARMLERLGCTVDMAEDGRVALEVLLTGKRGTPSKSTATVVERTKDEPVSLPHGCDAMALEDRYAVLFVDNQMPKLTGVELARKIREIGRNDYFVGVTGNAMTHDQDEYIEAGANLILTKPVREDVIRETLMKGRARLESAKCSTSSSPTSSDSTQNTPPNPTLADNTPSEAV